MSKPCTHERMCCDGLCQQDRHCPAISAQHVVRLHRPSTHFAPGVIDGPYTARHGRRWPRELRRNTRRLARALWRHLKGATPWL